MTDPATSVTCSRSPQRQPNASIVDRFDTLPEASTRAIPYRNDPVRGSGSNAATGNELRRNGRPGPPDDGDNRGGTRDAIRRSAMAITAATTLATGLTAGSSADVRQTTRTP
jgi:hypothetical protein